MPRGEDIGGHYGGDGSVCSYYVNVPNGSSRYTATLKSTGDADLFIAFDKEPESWNSAGITPACSSTRSESKHESCSGELDSETSRVYVKIEGYTDFANGVVKVIFA